MKTLKMSLANIQGKLSRAEMKKVMAGSGSDNCNNYCDNDKDCNGGMCPKCHPISNWAGKNMCIQ